MSIMLGFPVNAVRFLRMGELQPLTAGFGFGQHEFIIQVLRPRAAASHAIYEIVFDEEDMDLWLCH